MYMYILHVCMHVYVYNVHGVSVPTCNSRLV